ncbi:MAG TPA: hypothetical protein VGK67_21250 [Myxococcales bacterium]|jgi:hypothetical protein
MEQDAAPNLMVEPSTGAAFERQPEIGGRRYQTIGVGVRKLFLAPLYSIGLAVERGQLAELLERTRFLSEHAALDQRFFSALVDLPVDKAAFLVFHHDFPRERAQEAMAEGLRRSLGRRDETRIARVLDLLKRDLQRGDRIHWRSSENRLLTFELDGVVDINDRLLARGVWVPYLGPDPVSASLKQRMARFLAAGGGLSQSAS